MPLIYSHDNKTEITGLTKDDAYHVVDLSPFVQNQNCIGVLLQFENTHPSVNKDAGYQTTWDSAKFDIQMWPNRFQILLAKTWVYGSPYVNLSCEDSYVDVYIMAEFLKDGGAVLRGTDSWYIQPNMPVGWITVTVQPMGDDTYDDIEAALVYGVKYGGQQAFAARPLGSTVETEALTDQQVFAMPVKTNANGQYQIYIPTAGCGPPSVHCKEIGYIKKGFGFKAIFEPEDLGLSTNTDFEDLSLRRTIDSYSTHVVIRLIMSSGSSFDTASVRAKGSTDPEVSLSNGIWAVYWTAVDEIRALEYRYQGNGAQPVVFDVWGYVEDPPPDYPLTVENDQVTLAPGTINIE